MLVYLACFVLIFRDLWKVNTFLEKNFRFVGSFLLAFSQGVACSRRCQSQRQQSNQTKKNMTTKTIHHITLPSGLSTDKIKAGKHFQIESLSRLEHAALRLAMAENAAMPADAEKIGKLCQRFKIGKPFSFYSQRPELFW